MINPEDETVIVKYDSCSKDEAVAKMIGWMRNPKRLKHIKFTKMGVDSDYFEHMPTVFGGSILDLINQQREIARNKLLDIAEESIACKDKTLKDSFLDAINTQDDVIKSWDEKLEKAILYLNAIEKELSKGTYSELQLDEELTQVNGSAHITLLSLCDWAKDKLNILVLDEASEIKDKNRLTIRRPKRIDPLCAELMEILKDMDSRPSEQQVMFALKQRVGVRGTCVMGDIGYGIKWEKSNLECGELSIDGLRLRLETLIGKDKTA